MYGVNGLWDTFLISQVYQGRDKPLEASQASLPLHYICRRDHNGCLEALFMAFAMGSTIQRRRIVIQGIVQGVGFRPFVYGQALQRELAGFVLNDSSGVTIEVEGTSGALDDFQRALHEEAPPLSRIDSVVTEVVLPLHESAFIIAHSEAGTERHALISPDTATCDDCLRELFDPSDRRY